MLLWLLVLAACALALWFWIWRFDPIKLKPTDFGSRSAEEALVKGENPPTSEKYCIIGAGFCGLAIGVAFQRHRIPFDIVEKTGAIGGNWSHGVYETVHIISSRKTTEYKDWPMPSTYPDFPSAAQMNEYLNGYVEHFNLRKHIQLNSAVETILPVNGGEHWEVVFASGEKRMYRGVVVAIGHHWDCRMPNYPGQREFPGEIIHSKQYKAPHQLRGKRVLVIGGGNSACDIAVEAARFGECSHVSMRRGYWFLPRTICGMPLVDIVRPYWPLWLQRLIIRAYLALVVGDFGQYGLQTPDHKIFEHHPTINSELLHYIKLGRICPHPDIKCFHSDGTVEFVDGKREAFDLVVCATGYHLSFPMIPKEVVPFTPDGLPLLVNGLMPENFKNLYVFGIAQVRYGAGPVINVGADLLAELIYAQHKMQYPLGAVMKKAGAKYVQRRSKTVDIISDPHVVHRQCHVGKWWAKNLPTIEKVMVKLGVKFPEPPKVVAGESKKEK